MEYSAAWPSDHRQLNNKSSQNKGKGKARAQETILDYPSLKLGSLNALTLFSDSGRLEWKAVAGASSGKKLEATRDAMIIFPVTRSMPPQKPNASVLQRSEQGANFLRTYYPDIEIPSELIRDEIHADTRISRKHEKYDPYAGNLLDAVQCQVGLVSQATFLCFPMGESNQDLNISPFVSSQTGDVIFKPTAFPSQTFQTPIQQIVSSSPEDRKQASHLAIRTLSSTSLLEVKATFDGSVLETQLIERAIIDSSDTGGRPIVDVRFASSPAAGIVVNDQGSVYKCNFGGGWKSLQLLYTSPVANDTADDFFWRSSLIDSPDGCILASDKHLTRLDWRTSGNSLDLFSLRRSGDVITSMEGPQADNLIRLCSTTEILWIDSRFTRSPLMGYEHGRSYDRTLETRTLLLPTPLTFLTSRKNGLVTVYDVSLSDDSLIRSNVPAYSLPPVSGYDTRNTGHLLSKHPSNGGNRATLYQLSERGSIHGLDFGFPPFNTDRQDYEWSADVRRLAAAAHIRTDMGPLAPQVASEVDLHPAYRKIFSVDPHTQTVTDQTQESVEDTLEKMITYWQGQRSPERMLTMFDIAFASSQEPLEYSRADFLTQSDINCKAGYHALMQDRIPRQRLVQDAQWHYDLTPILNKLDSEIPRDPQSLVDQLRKYDLASEAVPSSQFESDAREQLALDLALSTDVLSPRPCMRPVKDDLDALETMSRATEAMSLADEPPPVHLMYLRPKLKGGTDGRRSTQSRAPSPAPRELDCPIGVRLLLKEWELGADPRDYSYEDPYDESYRDASPVGRSKNMETSTQATQATMPAQSQRPPLVMASKSLNTPTAPFSNVLAHDRLGIQSQGSTNRAPIFRTGNQITANDPGIGASSQDFVASTQVLPGPFGGRQPIKKKPTKKRLGGF